MNTYKLTVTDRCVINRFLISVCDKIKFSTRCIRQHLTMQILEGAFREVEQKSIDRIEQIKGVISDFDNGKMSPSLKEYFGEKVTRKDIEDYVESLIAQEKEVAESIKKSYHISVDQYFNDEKGKSLHESFNPRVTFGYSNVLHEECEVALTKDIRNLLYKTQLCKLDRFNKEAFGYGSFTVEEIFCSYYEDTSLYLGDKALMESISHEQTYDLFLDQKLLDRFKSFEQKKERNEKIIKKLY